jgi:Ras-related protein Rab-8A
MKQIEQHASENVNKVLIGNKCDVPASERRVTTEQGKKLAEEYGIKFFETSAKEKINVDEAFMTIAKDIVQR